MHALILYYVALMPYTITKQLGLSIEGVGEKTEGVVLSQVMLINNQSSRVRFLQLVVNI